MIHGYHVIWGTYGFWLPNDPRGSWSDFVFAWELAKFGKATKSIERTDIDPVQYAQWRQAAEGSLKFPPVTLTGRQALQVAHGFNKFIEKSNLTAWACSIMPQHVHFVFGRHRYKIESAANLLKGEATRRLVEVNCHPMEQYRNEKGRLPSMWGENQWVVSRLRGSDRERDSVCGTKSRTRRTQAAEMVIRNTIYRSPHRRLDNIPLIV